MENERGHLAGIGILEVKDISKAMFKVTQKFSKQVRDTFGNLNEKVGQVKMVVVATVDEVLMVVDGDKYLKSLKSKKEARVYCKNLGSLSRKEYVLVRLLLNMHPTRLEYLDISKMIGEISDGNIDNQNISNKTGIPLADVERYQKLLDFDWKQYEKEEINLQFNPFENI